MKPGLMVIFEGIDGAGKSTQRELIAERLRADGYDVVLTREPGGTPFAETIRDIVLYTDRVDEKIYPETELLLMMAARVQHIQNVINPAIQAGKIVLCDRFVLSTFAYQVYPYLTEDNTELLEMLTGLLPYVIGKMQPPITVLLTIPDDVRKERMVKRGSNNSLDKRDDEFYAKVHEAMMLHSKSPDTVTIDGNREESVVTDEIYNILTDYMKRRDAAIEEARAQAQQEAAEVTEAQTEVEPTQQEAPQAAEQQQS